MFHPFGNGTTLPPAQWHPEPNYRGTWSVLSSCLLTMFLCVWTAVHLNLPEHKKEYVQTFRKAGWLVLGLLAPEVVAWNALEQRRQVTKLTREMQQLYRSKNDIQNSNERSSSATINRFWRRLRRADPLKRGWCKIKVFLLFEAEDLDISSPAEWPLKNGHDAAEAFWTDLHSWYVVMGGIAFDTSSAEKPFLPGARERIVLSAEGVLELYRRWPELLPKLSRGDIEDKSKSDTLAKLITCWQASWFCIQCICRLAQGLSISLLELNVFGHAICTFLIYALWWTKPKDVSEPTKLSGSEANSAAAWLSNSSPIGFPQLYNQRREKILGSSSGFLPHPDIEDHHEPHELRIYPEHTSTTAYYQVKNPQKPWCLHAAGTSWQTTVFSAVADIYIAIDGLTVNRLSLMRQSPQTEWPDPAINLKGPFVSYRNKDWCLSYGFLRSGTLALLPYLFGLSLACGLYGGLHATAWYTPFPSESQQLLWRASSATVASSGIGCAILKVQSLSPTIAGSARNHREKNHKVKSALLWVLWGVIIPPSLLIVPASALWYCFCRTFLIVESFINVAHLSARDLSLPSWTAYVPHLS